MADTNFPNTDNATEVEPQNEDIIEYINENSLDSLKSRFGFAEEDESIRNQGFKLATTGKLIHKTRVESSAPFIASIPGDNDIRTDSEPELSRVFDSARSDHDNDNVSFSDLDLNAPSKIEEPAPTEVIVEEIKEEPEIVESKPKATRKKAEKKPAVEPEIIKAGETPAVEPEIIKSAVEPDIKTTEEAPIDAKAFEPKLHEEQIRTVVSDLEADEEVIIVRKYNTHTKVIYSDESLDDGIKRNSDSELEEFFDNATENRRKNKLWPRKKK